MFIDVKNNVFKASVNGTYVDKSELIADLNSLLDNPRRFLLFSRSRRFGKTYTIRMLNAYYSKRCESKEIFDKLKIADDPTYLENLNKYNVLCLDMQCFVSLDDPNGEHFLSNLTSTLLGELKTSFPKAFEKLKENAQLEEVLPKILDVYDNQFVFIIDDFDLVFRNYKDNSKLQESYAWLLTFLFKSQFAEDGVKLAYMTGSFPIKRFDNPSLVNNFREISMLKTYGLGEYMGFTEDEVKALCEKYDIDFTKKKQWYEGYRLDGFEIFNPYAIIELTKSKVFDSTWSNTVSNIKIINEIRQNCDGLREDLASLINGETLFFELPSNSSNALYNSDSKQAIFTSLIYLGYFCFNNNTIFIPNENARRGIIDIFDTVSLSKKQ